MKSFSNKYKIICLKNKCCLNISSANDVLDPSFMKDLTITFGVNLYTNIKKQYIM